MAATVLVQPEDGRIVVGGYSGAYAALARYTNAGAPDATSGGGTGKVTLSVGTAEANLSALKRDSAGRYVFTVPGRPPGYPSMLVRVLPTGVIDLTFGVRNLTTAPAALGTLYHSYDLQLTADDRILVAGTLWTGTDGFSNESVIHRFDASGALDTTFGSGGAASPHLPLVDEARSLGIQADGSILLLSRWGDPALPNNREVFATSRYLADGTPDSTYGVGGLGQIARRRHGWRPLGWRARPVGQLDRRGQLEWADAAEARALAPLNSPGAASVTEGAPDS